MDFMGGWVGGLVGLTHFAFAGGGAHVTIKILQHCLVILLVLYLEIVHRNVVLDGWVGGWVGGWVDGWEGGGLNEVLLVEVSRKRRGWRGGWVGGWVGRRMSCTSLRASKIILAAAWGWERASSHP